MCKEGHALSDMGPLYELQVTHCCCYEPVMPDVKTDAGHCPLLFDLS